MQITNKTLPTMIAGSDAFVSTYASYVEDALRQARLFPRLSKPRLMEARGAWKNDLNRVEEHEPNLTQGLDHFKHAAHLVFWLRRMSPLIECDDMTANPQDSFGYDLSEDEKAFRSILLPYANEYLAFDFGFQIVKFYEVNQVNANPAARDVFPSRDYYKTAAHFLKYKTVSPHALNLTYKSLFVQSPPIEP